MIEARVTRKKVIKDYETKLEDVVREFLPPAALIVESDAKLRVPVDKGLLRASIGSNIGVGRATIGTNVNYAPHVEYGTVKMGAQPYLRPAIDSNRRNIVDLFRSIYRRVFRGR